MILKINLESEVPIYQQIRRQIIEGIAVGALKPGESLPSVRMLASDLGINLHTVNKAYHVLKQDGFIVIHRQKGVLVNLKSGMAGQVSHLLQLKENLVPFVTEAYCRGFSLEKINDVFSEIYQKLEKGGNL